ncbi:Box C/D snoRNA accumulation [Kickxella alabastrina]|uniref:Box C/D snoRNA accumulation n=1 Tax=Kickxella alabastrina TaxID=61397 RepID=A0ACC1IF96_9FUNG|nr:Box C/D snoRNA accumulation [Kickxella alabastrina]
MSDSEHTLAATATKAESTSSIEVPVESADSPQTNPPAATPATNCEQCGSQTAKYKCPGCMLRTCSLACSKSHKSSTNCSGTRDKTKFIKRAEYDANTLMSDYGFLQDIAREHVNLTHEVQDLKILAQNKAIPDSRRPAGPQADNTTGGPVVVLGRAQKNVVARAKTQRQVQIRYMSPGIQRSKLNRTIWASRWSRLVWTLEIVIPELDCEPRKWTENGFHDVCRLGDLWTRLLDHAPNPSIAEVGDGSPKKRIKLDGGIKIKIPSDNGDEYVFWSSIKPETLLGVKRMFAGTPVGDLVWLVAVQDMPANKPTFCRIDSKQPLFTQLQYQTVLEFPTFYVYSQVPTTWNGHPITIQEGHTKEDAEDIPAEVNSAKVNGEDAAVENVAVEDVVVEDLVVEATVVDTEAPAETANVEAAADIKIPAETADSATFDDGNIDADIDVQAETAKTTDSAAADETITNIDIEMTVDVEQ